MCLIGNFNDGIHNSHARCCSGGAYCWVRRRMMVNAMEPIRQIDVKNANA